MPDDEMDYKRLFQLCLVLIFTLSGLGIISPILPLIQDWGGVSTTQIGFYVASFALARIFFNFPAGVVSDRYGSGFLMIIGAAVIMAGMLMSALAPDFSVLFVGRIISGIGSAIASVSIQTEMLLLAKPSQNAIVMSYFMLARRTGTSIFPFVGGALAALFSWRMVFYLCASLNLAGLIIALILYHQPTPAPKESPKKVITKKPVPTGGISPWIFPSLFFATFVIWANRSGLEGTNIPLYGGLIGLDSLQIGTTLSVTSIISLFAIYLGGRFANRFSCKRVFQIGLIGLVMACSWFFTVNTFKQYFVANIFFGLAGFTVALPMAIAANLSRGENLGRSVGAIRFFMDCGMLLGPVFLGWVMDLYGFHASIGISLFLLAAAFFLTTRFFPQERNSDDVAQTC